jgi:hypothetical protein
MPKVEYDCIKIYTPGHDLTEWLNDRAKDGWRLVGIWSYVDTGLAGSFPAANFYFERPNPEYLKELERERRREMSRRHMPKPAVINNFTVAHSQGGLLPPSTRMVDSE